MRYPCSSHLLRHLLVAACAAALLLADVNAARTAEPQDTVLDEVLVIGEQPGPAMWKVSNGSHTLWILGTLSPLPAKFTWRSRQVEQVIARSGEILESSVSVARFESRWAVLRNARGLLRLRHNANGATLREVLPAAVYTRWFAAHRRWFGKDPDADERARPIYAAELLVQQALERSQLSGRPVVRETVERLAHTYQVRTRRREFVVELENPKSIIAELSAIPREREAACLVATLDYLDEELPDLRRRAIAWARGDIDALRNLPKVDARTSCLASALEDTRLRAQAEKQIEAIRTDWAGIVDWMLLQHETSFTTLPISRLLDEGDEIARLRKKGYTVEVPR